MSAKSAAVVTAFVIAGAAAATTALRDAATSDAGSKSSTPYGVATRLNQPRLFAEHVLSTADDELGGTFSPDGRDFYFAKRTPSTITSSLIVICVAHYRRGGWSRPEIAPFSGRFIDFSPSFSPDGSRLFFASIRPVDGKERTDTDIWYVEKSADGSWSAPRNLGAPIDSSGPDQNASAASDGTIYFASVRPEGKGSYDLFRSRRAGGRYLEPENLGDAINTENPETHPCIAPDQSYLIFASVGRQDSPVGAGSPYPRADLYVSFNREGKWTPARRLESPVNTEATETSPFVSPDGRYLFFTSERNFTSIPMPRRLSYDEMQSLIHRAGNGLGDIYQIDWSATGIEEMRTLR